MQIPGPDTRVVELRVHGILGNDGEKLTDSVASVDVAGDESGRIVRPADRLLRPVPGPVLTTRDGTVPRIIEGYVWGRMTSGGWTRATWALLFPFALANAAHWMLPPLRDGDRVGGALSNVLRALLRLASVLLTMLMLTQITVVSLDLLAAQCLQPGSGCLNSVPTALRGVEWLRSSVALLPAALAVLVMHRLSTVAWRVSAEKTRQQQQHSSRAPLLPGANVVTDPDTPALRSLHSTAALSTVTVMALGGPFVPGADLRWYLAVGSALLAVAGVLALDDPAGMRGHAFSNLVRRALGPIPRRALLVGAGALLVATAIRPGPMRGPMPGSSDTIDLITLGLLVTCLATAVVLAPAARRARPLWSDLPRTLRPWAGGWMAAPILAIACLLGTGFGAGLALAVRQTVGFSGFVLPAAYDDVTIFWGASTLLMAVVAVGLTLVVLFGQWRAARSDSAVPPEVPLLHPGRAEEQRQVASAWRWAQLRQRHAHRIILLFAAILTASTVLTLVVRFAGADRPGWAQWLVGLGVLTLAALAVALFRMVQQAAKTPDTTRHLGILCDLVLFWPREAHPVVPPCYALKVVPELAARAAEHLDDPNNRVVLVGHSQGSLLAAVATARLLDSVPELDRERIGLVTAGSQLQWAYPRAFPGVISHSSLQDLSGNLGGRWRSLCRGTDPLGGAVTTWSRQVFDGMLLGVGFRSDGSRGPLPAATRGPTGALVLGGDHWLPDPQRGPVSFRRWSPGVQAHGQYSGDPEWDRAVAFAAGLDTAERSPAQAEGELPPVPAPPQADSAPLTPHGGDGESLIGPDQPEPEQPEPKQAEATEPEQPEPPQPPHPRVRGTAGPTPDLAEPRGRNAPWERAMALGHSER